MMRLLSYNYAVQRQILFSHARRHRHPPKKRAEPTIRPYQYFLNYTYAPIKVGNITGNSLKFIALYDISGHFKKLRMAQKGGLINHYVYQRFLKIRARRKWESALIHGRHLFNQVNDSYNDHKYAQIYEEGIINKMVQVFQQYYFLEDQKDIKGFCILLQRILSNNDKLNKQIRKICLALNIKHDALEKQQNLRDSEVILSPWRKILPQKLFQMINYPVQYTRSYNTVKREESSIFLTDEFTNLTIKNVKKHKDDFRPIIERQVKYLNNVMLTKLDYLIAIQYIFSKGYYNADLIAKVDQYISNYLDPKQHANLSQERYLCEQLLLCNILQHIIRNFKEYKAISKDKAEKSKIMASYEACLNRLATKLQNVSFRSLQIILQSHYKILQRYLLVTFDDEKTLNRFKDIYYRLFGTILDFNQNGILLIESAKDINFIFEVILSMYTIEDQERILQILQKYENILMLNPDLQEKQVANNYKALYLICLKYSFKSNIFVSSLLANIELKIATRELKGKQRGMELSGLSNVLANSFTYFLYLMVAETRSKEYDQVQQLWVQSFQKINLQLSIQSHWNQRRDDFDERQTKRQYLSSISRKHLPTKYSKISRLNQLLVMMSKMLGQGKHKELINNKFEDLCQIQKLQSLIRQEISYPNVFEHFMNIVKALQPKDSQIVEFIQSVQGVINQNVKKDNNNNQQQVIKTHELINYQQFNDFLHNYAVFIDDFCIYRAKRFNSLIRLNPYLRQIVAKISKKSAVQYKFDQQMQQRGLEFVDQQPFQDQQRQIISSIEQVAPGKSQAFFKESKRQAQSKQEQRQIKKVQKSASAAKIRQARRQRSKFFSKKQQRHDEQPKMTTQSNIQQSTNLSAILGQINQCFAQLKSLKSSTPYQAIAKSLQYQGPRLVMADESTKPKPKPKRERRRSDLLNKIKMLKTSRTVE